MFYQGDAISEIQKIKSTEDGHLDFSTMPVFAKKIMIRKDKGNKDIIQEERDLGAMISMLTVAVQQLAEKIILIEEKTK